MAVAIPDKTALVVARAFVEHYVLKHGIPERVLTDQGSEFEAEPFQALCREFGIQKDRTTAYHPQANGMVERMNRTLAGKLKRMAAANQQDWDEHLPYALFVYALDRGAADLPLDGTDPARGEGLRDGGQRPPVQTMESSPGKGDPRRSGTAKSWGPRAPHTRGLCTVYGPRRTPDPGRARPEGGGGGGP